MSTTADPRVSGGGTASNGADGGRSAGLPLFALIALVVGSMIGGGIFNLPRQMASAAAPGPLLIGWLITGVGMLMLAFIFQTLAELQFESGYPYIMFEGTVNAANPIFVEDAVRATGSPEVPANEVGLAILGPLRDLDEVAYLRFASVYRSFSSAEDFEREIEALRAHREVSARS